MNAPIPRLTSLYAFVSEVLKKCLLLLLLSFSSIFSFAQCTAGYNEAILNWDYLDFLVYRDEYDNGYLTDIAQARTQYFSFGTQRLTIVADNNYSANDIRGDNTSHSGEAGSYGNYNATATDADVEFRGDGTIVITFENEVMNLRFSMFDVDRDQRLQFDARNAANTPLNVDLTTLGTTILTLTNDNAPNAIADAAAGTNVANNAVTASFNVDITGPVKSITITVSNTDTDGSNENGAFWLSDITACSVGSFPLNYYAVSKPFTGQPGYVLHALEKSVYAVNPANGRTKLLFTDATGPAGSSYINSMAYDPYNKILYYVYSLTSSPSTNRTLKKYDFNTESISTVLANVNTIGIPTTDYAGVESGAAAFYNGSWYLGIETSNTDRNSDREAVIWRIDFNGSNVPYRASQVFALPIDDGNNLIHDWADFVINDGMLYNFDGAGVTTFTDIYHFNLQTGVGINYPLPAGFTPGQPNVGWNGNIYQLHALNAAGTSSDIAPYIALYNGNGTIGPRTTMTSTPSIPVTPPSLGDAAEAFKPKSDFGDAPASFTPAGIEPATHERLTTLRLGSAYDHEWTGTSSALADADGVDEDGIGAAPALNYNGVINYSLSVSVFNNTGTNATLIGWLDYDFDGIFDVSEGVSVNIPSNVSAQTISIPWNNIWVQLTSLTNTFLRLRLTSSANGMTTTNVNGYFPDGEVEDFMVVLGILLPKDIQSFKVEKTSGLTVDVKWNMLPAVPVKNFEVLRSTDAKKWELITTVQSNNTLLINQYKFTDLNPVTGISYYRIQINYVNGANKFTSIESVIIDNKSVLLKLSPNPAIDHTVLQFDAKNRSSFHVELLDSKGRTVRNFKSIAEAGNNSIMLDLKNLIPGIYTIHLAINDEKKTTRLVVGRQ